MYLYDMLFSQKITPFKIHNVDKFPVNAYKYTALQFSSVQFNAIQRNAVLKSIRAIELGQKSKQCEC